MTASRQTAGLTLLELLVVVGLMSALAMMLIGGLGGGGGSAALQAAQATLANLVTAARVQASASGKSARLLFHMDATSSAGAERYLRCIVLQFQDAGGWHTMADACLPEGIYVVPGNFEPLPAGLFAANTAAGWTKTDGSPLLSTALRANQVIVTAINGPETEQWVALTIAAAGTTAQAGDLILAAGRRRAPGEVAGGGSPVELTGPEAVRGLSLSAYGVPVLVNNRASF